VTKEIDILEKTKLPFSELGVSSASEIEELFRKLLQKAEGEAKSISTEEQLEELRIRWLGRKRGVLTLVTENWLVPAPPPSKPWVGTYLNWFKEQLANLVGYREHAIRTLAEQEVREAHVVDLTLPGNIPSHGARHLITQTMEEICDIFLRLGFSVVEGPEIETAYYNFEALNMPAHHPARDMWDTLYLNLPGGAEPLLLRTHTSPMQIRVMEKQKPPVRVVVPGKVYRHDNPDASHSFMFHQIEGLAVDRDITFGDLKGVLDHFLREFFGPQTRTRFVPSYFPFTEPSADVHGSCHVCGSAGCRVCKFTGWIELVGCGMVDPNVYGFVGYDAQQLSGFAFGMGVDRFAMLKYGIDDIQLFFQNDVRFLTQFRR